MLSACCDIVCTLCFVSYNTALYERGSICNENPIITQSINVLGFYAICQKDQSVAVIMMYKTLFDLSKFNELQTF